MLDSGVTMSCMHPDVVIKYDWDVILASKYMHSLVLNADRTQNQHGSVTQECQLLVRYEEHSEWMHVVIPLLLAPV